MHAQDKGVMRARLDRLGVPCPRHEVVADAGGRRFAEPVRLPVVLKTTRGGYDGKGVWVVGRPPMPAVFATAHRTESACWQRSRWTSGASCRRWSPGPRRAGGGLPRRGVVQSDGICCEVTAPAPGLDPELAV